MPPRGYCPLCVVETTEADEVEVANVGTITTFSVITPLQYQGQEETEDYVQAHDAPRRRRHHDHGDAHGRHRDRRRAHGHARAGACSRPRRSGSASASASMARGMGLGDAVERWEPTGEPDLTREQIAEHIL